MSSSLTWSEKFNCGHSEECYFGSLPNQKNAIMVYRSIRAGVQTWQIMFNDASMRFAKIEHHASLVAAQAYAETCMLQPICERGYRSLANNAALIASRLCATGDSVDDIEAAIAIGHESYPNARLDDIRRRMGEIIGGAFKRAA